jgi:hypothetical protein
MYSIGGSAEFFCRKNGPQKCCDFAELQQRNRKLEKAGFFLPQKAMPMLRKMPKTALF